MANDREYEDITKQMHSDARQALNGRPHWSTRPAAPVDGLKTKGYMRPEDHEQMSFWVSNNQNAYYREAVVLRSQAEAIIVAKDARIKELEAEVAKREEHRGKLMKGYRGLETRLAAAKEREEHLVSLLNAYTSLEDRFEDEELRAVLENKS